MRDKSTPAPPDDSGPDGGAGPGPGSGQDPEPEQTARPDKAPPVPRRRSLKRTVATAVAVAAAALALSWYFSRRPVEVTVVMEFEKSRRTVRKARVELERDGKIHAHIEVTVTGKTPGRSEQKLEVRKGRYTLRTIFEYTDGSRKRSSRKIKVEGATKWVIAVH